MKKCWAKAWRGLAVGSLLILGLTVTTGVFLVGTGPGQRWLAEQMSVALSADAYSVRVEGLRVAWPLRVALTRVAVADPDGVWLEIRDADIRLAPWALWTGRIVVPTLRMDSLDLARLPTAEATEPTETSPLHLPEFVVETVEFAQLRLAPAVCGFPVEVTGWRGRVAGGMNVKDAAWIGIEAQAVRATLDQAVAQRVAGKIALELADDHLALSGTLTGDGFAVSSALEFRGDGTWPTGDFRAEVVGASGLTSNLWPGLSADRLVLAGIVPPRSGGIEDAQVCLEVENLRYDELMLKTATVETHLHQSRTQSDLTVAAEAQVEQFSFGDVEVTTAEFRVAGPWGALAVTGKVAGTFQKPFAAEAAGHLQWAGTEYELEVPQASARWAGAQARLTEPLRIWIQGEQSSLRGAAKLESLNLATMASVVPGLQGGHLAGEVRLGGALTAPEMEGSTTWTQVVARAETWGTCPPLDGLGQFSVSGGVLRVAANARMATNGSARLQAQIPMQVALLPWELGLDQDRDYAVESDVELDLALLGGLKALAKFKSLSGRLETGLRLGGTFAAPTFDGEVRCTALATQAGVLEQVPALDGSGQFNYSNGMLRAVAEAKTSTNGSAHLQAQIPMQVALLPWELGLDQDRDLTVALTGELELAVLNRFDAFANGRIGGRIDLSVAHLGSLSSGSVTGECVLSAGEYENYSLGTVVRGANLRLISSGQALVMESGSATDGGKGRVAVSGSLRPDPTAGLPYEVEIDCRQMRLLRRPDAEATISGKLTLAGTMSRLQVAGDLQVDKAVVDLRNLRPPPPAELEPSQPIASAANIQPSDDALALQLAVSIPGSLYVRGSLFDTAWGGNLVLLHTRGEFGLSGYLEPRRGTVLLLKRPFKLDEGRIDFDGRWPPEPLLSLTAIYTRADLTARAQILGPSRDPDVFLTSDPSLPEDEILSQILFGANLASLTPLQAISLASEVAKLRNITGGGGVLDGVQAALGIDRIELRETGHDAGEAEVAIGKYVGDRSYIEMRRAATMDSAQGARFFLEHELRPNIALEAESGLEMRSGVGLFWKRDY